MQHLKSALMVALICLVVIAITARVAPLKSIVYGA